MTDATMNLPHILEQHRLWRRGEGGSRANLSGANLSGADVIDGGQRSDGYRFVGSVHNDQLMIGAGCRYFTIAEGRDHWQRTRGDTPLGAETMCILDHIERVAVIRGLVKGSVS